MNRQSVKHTPLPADDLEEPMFDSINVHQRRLPNLQKRETTRSDNLTDEQYSDEESETHSRNSTDLNDSIDPNDASHRVGIRQNELPYRTSIPTSNSTARGNGNGNQHQHQHQQNWVSTAARPMKQPRKRKAKEPMFGVGTTRTDSNANTFQQIHTLNFLPPPPPRDTPPVGIDSQSLAASSVTGNGNATLEHSAMVQSQAANAVLWSGTLQNAGNLNSSAAHIYYPYASATLLQGGGATDGGNIYYLSSANQALLQHANEQQLFDYAAAANAAAGAGTGAPVWPNQSPNQANNLVGGFENGAHSVGSTPKHVAVNAASYGHTIGFRPSSNVFASAQHTPLLQPAFLKTANLANGQCAIINPPPLQNAAMNMNSQLIVDDSANASLLNGQQATPYQHSNGSATQYETLSRMNASRPLETTNTVNLLNGTGRNEQQMDPTGNQQDMSDAARAFLGYNSKYAVKFVNDSKKCSGFCTWRTAAIFAIAMCILLIPFIIYFCVAIAKAESSYDSAPFDVSSVALQPDGVPVRVQLKPFRMWYATYSLSPSANVWDDYSKRLHKLRIAFREPDSYYRLALFVQYNYRPTALRYEDRYVLAKEDTLEANNATKMLVTVNSRQRREADVSLYKSFAERGAWYIGLYADSAAAPLSIVLSLEQVNATDESSSDCRALQNCNGAGLCIDRKCACLPGYSGESCEPRTCPVLCNGRGFYYKGACQCFPPFSGAECEVRLDDPCSNVNCNNHGVCKNGQCVCDTSYGGPTCSEVSCKPHNCNGNGHCQSGTCRCYHGWTGDDCGQSLLVATAADSTTCGRNGAYDPINRRCTCNSGYTGSNCESKLCNLPCVNGMCLNGRCMCEAGWSGKLCDVKECGALCNEHGRCVNGTCVCAERYFGTHCNHEFCPNNCNNFGVCTRYGSTYACRCAEGRNGDACEYAAEVCDDNVDNDGDTLVDCADPECCANPRCQASDTGVTTCNGVLAPEDAVLIRTKPARFPTFYDNTKAFFADEYSSAAVQQYAKPFAFYPAIVSVVFGYITLRGNEGLYACRIAVPDRLIEYGFVNSRAKGRFDMVVNGGQYVTFQISCREERFMRFITAYVPPATFVRLPNIDFDENDVRTQETFGRPQSAATDLEAQARVQSCSRFPHNPLKNRPRVFVQSNVPAYSNGIGTNCGGDSTPLSVTRLIPERRAVFETIRLPETNFHLVWSNTQNKYGLLVVIQLTPTNASQVDGNLNYVHLTINFAGNDAKVLRHRFVAQANLSYSFVWSRRDSYGQSRYGLVAAYIAAGYEYITCPGRVFWERQTLSLPSDILLPVAYGGWSIDAFHEYNPVDGMLIRGDSSTVYFRLMPKLVRPLLGSKGLRPRSLECTGGGIQCYALTTADANRLQLHNVLQLLPDSHGNVWVIDHNLIRYVQVNTSSMKVTVRTVLEMAAYSQLRVAPEPYYMALNMADAQLYISDPLQKLILRVNLSDSIYWRQTSETQKRPAWRSPSVETIAGTGEQCQPTFTCGDSITPLVALYEPKSIALDKFSNVYFIDGFSLRRIKASTRELETIIGNPQLPSGMYDRRMREPLCVGDTVVFNDLELLWPSAMRYSTYEDAIYLVTHNHVLLRLYLTDSVAFVVGSNCARSSVNNGLLLASLTNVVDLSIHDDGNVVLVERVKDRGNRIIEIKTDGTAAVLMNFRDDATNVPSASQSSDSKAFLSSASANFSNINTIAYLPNGEFLFSENGQGVIYQAHYDLPELAPYDNNGRQEQQYRIRDPSTKETYVFNAAGKHVMTLHNNLKKKYQLDSGRLVEFSAQGEQVAQTRISVPERNQQNSNGHTVYQVETIRGRDMKTSQFYVDQKFNLVRFESESDNVAIHLRYGPPDSETLLIDKSVTLPAGMFNYSFAYDRNDMLTNLTVPDWPASRLITLDLQPVRFYPDNRTLSYFITSDQQRNLRIQAQFGGLEEITKEWTCLAVNLTASGSKWQRVVSGSNEQNIRVLSLASGTNDRRNRFV